MPDLTPVNLVEKRSQFDEHWWPRDGEVHLGPGELLVVPVGVEHRPYASEETTLLLVEHAGTANTGDPMTAAKRVAI